ncbi:MAG: hypothetical protein IPL36_04295 [Nigerium sp.]|nr:hypothetical protein [Nigerium sp.]
MVVSGVLVVVALPLLAVVVVLAAVVAGRRRSARLVFDSEAYPGLVALRRSTIALRWTGVVVGILAGVAVIGVGPLAPLAFASPLVAGIVAVAALLVGQQLSYSGARSRGSAGVETRRLRDYVPVGLARRVGAATGVLLTVCLFLVIAASPDDLGRPGRALTAAWVEHRWVADQAGVLQRDDAFHSGATSPFPGSFYVPAVLGALALLLALSVLGLWLTARRPRNGGDPELVRVDDALRRITAEGIVAAAGAGIAGGVLALSVVAYTRFGQFPQVPVHVACSYLGALVALGALASTLAFATTLLVPGNGNRR